MEKILFINACVRESSRTLVLARRELESYEGEITEVKLENEKLNPLTGRLLSIRDGLIANEAWDDPMLRYAKEFSEADRIVIAAPFWDLGFPALLKTYIEAIMVSGITFKYTNGVPNGLCRSKSLRYITTSGGKIYDDFGYSYIKSLAKNFFGISDVSCCRAEGLDIEGILPEELFEKAVISEVK